MKVFVFGGTGFIGNRTIQCLLANGHQVTSLARNEKTAAWLREQQVKPVMGDLVKTDTQARAIEGSDVAVNPAVPSFLGRLGMKRLHKLSQQVYMYDRNVVDAVLNCGGMPLLITEESLAYCDNTSNWIDDQQDQYF